MPIPGWTALNRIRLTRAIKVLWLWTIIVPVIAKLISSVPESITLPLTDTPINIPLRLPFSWVALYLSGVAFAIGGSAFAIRCPRLIQDFPDIRVLINAEVISPVEAATYVAELFLSHSVAISNTQYIPIADAAQSMWDYYKGPTGNYDLDEEYLRHPTSGVERIRVLADNIDARLDLLTRMYVFASTSRFWSRLFCSTAYLVGGAFMLFVLVQNFVYVIAALTR